MPMGRPRDQKANRPELPELTSGPILPSLVALLWPMMVASLLQTAYNLADTLWVGRVGASAVAGPVVLEQATGYLRIIFLGVPFMFGFFLFSSPLRGYGDTVTPNIILAVLYLWVGWLSGARRCRGHVLH